MEEIFLINEKGKVLSKSLEVLGTLIPLGNLGAGTFCFVDEFLFQKLDGSQKRIAVKRPRIPRHPLLREAKFQKELHTNLKQYKIEFCVPEVFQIFKFLQTGDIWFSMEAHNPLLLSTWLLQILQSPFINIRIAELLLQLALFLDVFESTYSIDHRDLKVNNILVIEEEKVIEFPWKGQTLSYTFPFWICFVDFGFACQGEKLDIREVDGLPTLEPCPKEGRDMFQVIVSIWYIPIVRQVLEGSWGEWIRDRIGPWLHHMESKDLDWLYSLTDDFSFKSPLCQPRLVIEDMIRFLEKIN